MEARYQDNFGRLELAIGHIDLASSLFDESARILEGRYKQDPIYQGLPEYRWQKARVDNNRALIVVAREGEAGRCEASCLFENSRRALALLLEDFPEVEPYRKELAIVEGNLALMSLVEAQDAFRDWAAAARAKNKADAAFSVNLGNISLADSIDGFTAAIQYLTPPPPSGGVDLTVPELPPWRSSGPGSSRNPGSMSPRPGGRDSGRTSIRSTRTWPGSKA